MEHVDNTDFPCDYGCFRLLPGVRVPKDLTIVLEKAIRTGSSALLHNTGTKIQLEAF
jgi:hypothetical protein